MVWLLLPFALLSLPLLFSTKETNYTNDESQYYLPAIRQIHAHWPRLDLKEDSLSATAPGYPYFLAGVSLITGTERLVLRMANWIISLGVLMLLYFAWPGGSGRTFAVLAILPLAASNFFVKSSANVVTDNPCLGLTTAALLALLLQPTIRALGRASLCSAAAVFVRQSQLWLLAPIALATLRASGKRWRYLFLLPPTLVLGWLVLSWGGLTPPAWREIHRASLETAPAAAAYVLAVVGLLGALYYAAARGAPLPNEWRNPWVLLGALGGLVIAMLSPTLPDATTGRWGGYLWTIAGLLPDFHGRSLLFLLLATLGGVVLALLMRRLWLEAGAPIATTWGSALFAWMGSVLLNRQMFHRYYEPTILVFLICWLLLLIRARSVATTRLAHWPLLGLAAAQTAVTLLTAHGRTFGFFVLP